MEGGLQRWGRSRGTSELPALRRGAQSGWPSIGLATPQQVQAHLRHKDLKTTMRYYEDRERLTDNASDHIQLG